MNPPNIHNYQEEVTQSLVFLELLVHLSYLLTCNLPTCNLPLPSSTVPGHQLIVKLHLVQRGQFFLCSPFYPFFPGKKKWHILNTNKNLLKYIYLFYLFYFILTDHT